MATIIPLLNGGNIPLRRSGTIIARTAQLSAGDTGLGRALQSVGGALQDIAEEKRKADDARQMLEFEAEMRASQERQTQFQQQNIEEDTWLPQWQAEETALNEKLSKMKVTPTMRLTLQSALGRFRDGSRADIQGAAFGQSKRRALMSFDNSFANAKTEDDVKNTAALLSSSNLVLPEQVTQAEQQALERVKTRQIDETERTVKTLLAGPNPDIDGAIATVENSPMEPSEKALTIATIKGTAARKTEIESLATLANTDPESAASLAMAKAKEGKISGLDAVELVEKSESVRATMVRDGVLDWKARIQSGQPVTAEELMADSRLSDEARDSLARMQDGILNEPFDFEQTLAEVLNFQPGDNEAQTVTKATNLEAYIEARFSGAKAENLKEELTKRRNPKPGEVAATDLGPALKMLDEEIERGALGPVTRPVMQDGKPLMRDPKKEPIGFIEAPGRIWGTRKKEIEENDGKPVPVIESDPVAREKAAAVQREIRRTLESEIQAGKLKDQSAITARTIDLFKAKGGKMTPQTGETAPNLLLPPLNAAPKDLNETLKKYGY